MKQSITPGAAKVRRIVIDKPRTIGFMGEEGRVYATPELVRDVEHLCRDFLLEHGDPGEDSVGIDVAMKHAAPTLLGMTVEIAITVRAVEGRKVTFDVAAKDDVEPIGSGSHSRFVVDVAKTLDRLKAKQARAAGARAG